CGAYKRNQYNYQSRNFTSNRYNNIICRRQNDFTSNGNNNLSYRQNNNNNNNNNIFYNRNFQQRYNRNSVSNESMYSHYGYTNGPQRSRSIQPRKRRPRGAQLNDFMPPPLRNTSSSNLPNLPQDFNLANDPVAAYARPNTPTAALTQRPMFLTQTITTDDNNNNTTQPFAINDDISNNSLNEQHQNTQQQQRPTTANKTASYKRRKYRNYQQQYRNMADNNDSNYNKFSELSDQDACTDIDSNFEYAMNDDTQLMNNNNNANNMNMNKQETKQNRNSKKKK
ncbi:unnamed protein product, partial [Rotaria magnacalcarata]